MEDCLILLLTEEFSIVIEVHIIFLLVVLDFLSQLNDVETALELEGLHCGCCNAYDPT